MKEIILEGTTALIAGMGTVFIVLILISLVLSLFEHIDPHTRKEKKIAKNPVAAVDKDDMGTVISIISVVLSRKLGTNISIKDIKKI